MLPPLKSLAVNWVDGMKINKDHFEQTDQFVKDSIRDSTALFINDFNYGLCPPYPGQNNPLNLKISIDPSKIIRVQLSTCRAVTPSGSRIEFDGQNSIVRNEVTDKLSAEFQFEDTKDKLFYVFLSVKFSSRIPTGRPDPEENPPRFPNVAPEYSLQIFPESQISLTPPPADGLVIGCLGINSGKLRVMEEFMPPCMTVNSFPPLQDSYFRLGNYMGEAARYISTIMDKIHSKSQTTTLVNSCIIVCTKMNDFIADNLGSFRWIYANQPPIYMLDCFLRMAYNFSMTLAVLPVKDKEELLNYVCEWVEENPSQINEKTTNLIKSEYNHSQTHVTLAAAEDFILMLHNIFYRLSQLDFIGKKKGERAFVQEKPVQEQNIQDNTQKKGWSFLAD